MTERTHIDAEAIVRLRHSGAAGVPDTSPAMRDMLDEWDRQDAALRALYDRIAEEPVPERFRALLAPRAKGRGIAPLIRRVAAVVALVAIGGVGGWGAARHLVPDPAQQDLPVFALRAHATYTPEIIHPVEVSADRAEHLAAWLTNRVGQPITLPDLSGEGFSLLGGRIVPDEHGAAALLMYEDAGGRRVTLYVASEPEAGETGFRYASVGGMDSLWWYGEGLGCAIVGELPRDRLRALAVVAYRQLLSL